MADLSPLPRPENFSDPRALFRENGLTATQRVHEKIGPVAAQMISELAQSDVVVLDAESVGPEVAAMQASSAYAVSKVDIDQDGTPDGGAIYFANMDETPEKFAGGLAGIDPSRMHDVPGTTEDYRLTTLFHEACHIPQSEKTPEGFELYGLPNELGADECVFDGLKEAHDRGHPVDVETAQSVTYDARLVGSLGVQDSEGKSGKAASHSTHIGLDAPNALPLTDKENIGAMLNVNRQFNQLTGGYMAYEAQTAIMAEQDPVQKGIVAEQYQYQEILNDRDTRERLGAEAATADPALAKAALETLRDKGYIQDDTPEAAYADRVLDFYDRHVDTTPSSEWRAGLTSNYMSSVPPAPMATPTAPSFEERAPMPQAPAARGMEF